MSDVQLSDAGYRQVSQAEDPREMVDFVKRQVRQMEGNVIYEDGLLRFATYVRTTVTSYYRLQREIEAEALKEFPWLQLPSVRHCCGYRFKIRHCLRNRFGDCGIM